MDEQTLDNIIASIKPSMVTPELDKITNLKNDKKAREISHIIVKKMVKFYNDSGKGDIPRVILHDGKATEVRYFDIEPLMSGVWSMISLMILQLSYGEQTMIIEAIYPKAVQFTAKAFAATFTETNDNQTPMEVKSDPQIVEKLDSANAGIAMILAMMGNQGYKSPHPDKVNIELGNMNDLVEASERSKKFKNATKRAQDAFKYNDMNTEQRLRHK